MIYTKAVQDIESLLCVALPPFKLRYFLGIVDDQVVLIRDLPVDKDFTPLGFLTAKDLQEDLDGEKWNRVFRNLTAYIERQKSCQPTPKTVS